jgi:hypothetical protein
LSWSPGDPEISAARPGLRPPLISIGIVVSIFFYRFVLASKTLVFSCICVSMYHCIHVLLYPCICVYNCTIVHEYRRTEYFSSLKC